MTGNSELFERYVNGVTTGNIQEYIDEEGLLVIDRQDKILWRGEIRKEQLLAFFDGFFPDPRWIKGNIFPIFLKEENE